MRDSLFMLQRAGYAPRLIIDGGANIGLWGRMAGRIFPNAAIHAIEPQPACRPALEHLARQESRISVHPVALAEAGVTRVRMIGAGRRGGSGAWVARPGEHAKEELECPATTLDALFANHVTRQDRTLLKLDVEGDELVALRGGAAVLRTAEVVLAEVQFFIFDDDGRPLFSDIVDFLREREFELYDFACLSSRPRDGRLRTGDVMFVRRDSPLIADRSWK
jgi:FkbM family methyltransferase